MNDSFEFKFMYFIKKSAEQIHSKMIHGNMKYTNLKTYTQKYICDSIKDTMHIICCTK